MLSSVLIGVCESNYANAVNFRQLHAFKDERDHGFVGLLSQHQLIDD